MIAAHEVHFLMCLCPCCGCGIYGRRRQHESERARMHWITESVSQNRRRRGRPSLQLNPAARHWGSTQRSRQNGHYWTRAYNVLRHVTGVDWLELDRLRRGERSRRSTVLFELGRIESDDELISAARRVCELQPRTSGAAVANLRRWRVGEADPVSTLTNQVIRLISRFRANHAATTDAQVRAALNNVRDHVHSESLSKNRQPC